MFCLSLLKLFPVNSSCLRGRRPGCYACHRRYAADQPYSSSPLLVYHRYFNLVYFNKAVYIHYYYFIPEEFTPLNFKPFSLVQGGGGDGQDIVVYFAISWWDFLWGYKVRLVFAASVGTSKREKVKNIISSFMSGSAFQPVPSTL